MTLHADGQDGHATQASSSDKTQQVATKAHGSQAPPAGNADETTSETIHTTAKHPWLTTDRGWVQAGDLRLGELEDTQPLMGKLLLRIHTHATSFSSLGRLLSLAKQATKV